VGVKRNGEETTMAAVVETPPEPKAPPVAKPPPVLRAVPRPTEAKVAEELAKIPYEPFLSVEAHLVTWSLVLGAVLLGVLVWVSYTFFGG
jgi:hypothetical protein